jgi:hypothetical protein
MSRKLVDGIWIRQRMNLKDARVQAAARTEAERRAFHLLLTHPGTAARLDAMLEDNRRIDAAATAAVVVDLEIVPPAPDAPRGPVVDVVLAPKKIDGAQ